MSVLNIWIYGYLTLSMIGFVRTPVSRNATVGATIQFSCQHRNGVVVWRINGERVNNLPAVSTESEGGVHTLIIRNASAEYDGAEIQCVVVFFDGVREPESASPVILRLQSL